MRQKRCFTSEVGMLERRSTERVFFFKEQSFTENKGFFGYFCCHFVVSPLKDRFQRLKRPETTKIHKNKQFRVFQTPFPHTWAHWTGDPSADWNKISGLPAQIPAQLNLGLSGIPFSGSDIGGFECDTGPCAGVELWIRWTQVGCFSSFMHEQGKQTKLGKSDVTHIFDWEFGTFVFRKFAKLRTQLFRHFKIN